MAAASIVLAVACGGDDDDGGAALTPGTTRAAAVTARDLLPKLDDIGFRMTQSGRDPGQPEFDSAVALYSGTGVQQQMQVRIYVLSSVEAATTQFDAFAAALRNPPPEFLGGIQAKFVDTTSPPIGEARKSYRTEAADSQGYVAYTDVYRKGRTVVLTQVVDATKDGLPARQVAGERALAAAP